MIYPLAIYNNKTRTTVTVQNKEQHDGLRDYFSDNYIGMVDKPYQEIHQSQAIGWVKDTLKEVKEEVKIIEKPIEKSTEINDINISSLNWTELKTYAKKLGVKVPLRANREEIERLIGNDK